MGQASIRPYGAIIHDTTLWRHDLRRHSVAPYMVAPQVGPGHGPLVPRHPPAAWRRRVEMRRHG
jgi:hypothetical protein